jgi:hypothetical protein
MSLRDAAVREDAEPWFGRPRLYFWSWVLIHAGLVLFMNGFTVYQSLLAFGLSAPAWAYLPIVIIGFSLAFGGAAGISWLELRAFGFRPHWGRGAWVFAFLVGTSVAASARESGHSEAWVHLRWATAVSALGMATTAAFIWGKTERP